MKEIFYVLIPGLLFSCGDKNSPTQTGGGSTPETGPSNVITYTSSKELTIGSEIHPNAFNVPIVEHVYKDNKGTITFADAVTIVGKDAFRDCNTVSFITLPSTITEIGESAFQGCNLLNFITIPNRVICLGNNAFYNCFSLTSINIPNNVISIGSYAFSYCTSLNSVSISNSVISIGSYAFTGCSSLPVENSLRYADTYLVGHIDGTLSTYTIKEGTKWIGNDAFCNCYSLKSITIPNSVIGIGDETFYNCSSLITITIPNGVTSIGNSAFSGSTSITSITIPNSVTRIGEGAFSSSSLTTINVDVSNTHYASVDGVLFNYAKDTLIRYPKGNIHTEYKIPNSVICIGDNAFYNCTLLTLITIPSSVTSIGNNAFSGNTSIISITSYATIPPTCSSSSFYSISKSIPLYVPSESVAAYEVADGWKDFTNIQSVPK